MAGQDIYTYNPGNPMEYNVRKLSQEIDSVRTESPQITRNAQGNPTGLSDPVTGQPVGGGGGGSTFTYDLTLQAAKANVDGTEVLAPKRSGSGILAQVVPRTNTFGALMATQGNAGELSYPSDASGVVQHSGVAGGAVWLSNESVAVINVNTDTSIVSDVVNGLLLIPVPAGARAVYLTTGASENPLQTGRPTGFRLVLGGGPTAKETGAFLGKLILGFDVAAEVLAGRISPTATVGVSTNASDDSVSISLDPNGDGQNHDYFEFMAKTTKGQAAIFGGVVSSKRVGGIGFLVGF